MKDLQGLLKMPKLAYASLDRQADLEFASYRRTRSAVEGFCR
jgi:hypothetical protein